MDVNAGSTFVSTTLALGLVPILTAGLMPGGRDGRP